MKTSWVQIVTIFLAGVLAALLVVSRCPIDDRRFAPKGPKMLERFSRELKLDAAQKDKVSVILEDTRKRLQILREETKPRFEGIRSETKSRIEAVLTPAQIETFRKIEARRDRDRERKWGPGRGR